MAPWPLAAPNLHQNNCGKNAVPRAPPFRTAEFDIMHDEGISRSGDILDLAVEVGVVEKRGSFYYYGNDLRIAQGREKAKVYLKENLDFTQEIEDAIRALLMDQSEFDDEAETDEPIPPVE